MPDRGKPNECGYGIAVGLAETGTASAQVEVLEKRRGIHTITIYEANIEMNARFLPTKLTDALPENAEPIWPEAHLFVGVSDTRGIKEAVEVTINNRTIPMEPAVRSRNRAGYSSVPIAGVKLAGGRVDNLATAKTPFEVTVRLRVGGAQRLAIGPFAMDPTLT